MEQFGLPLLASEHGGDVDKLIWYLHILMALLFVGWFAYFLYAIWRFRKSRNPKGGLRWRHESFLQLHRSRRRDCRRHPALRPRHPALVEGRKCLSRSKGIYRHENHGSQFYWTARYPGPDGIFGSNRVDLVSSENPMGLDKTDPAAKDECHGGQRDGGARQQTGYRQPSVPST